MGKRVLRRRQCPVCRREGITGLFHLAIHSWNEVGGPVAEGDQPMAACSGKCLIRLMEKEAGKVVPKTGYRIGVVLDTIEAKEVLMSFARQLRGIRG